MTTDISSIIKINFSIIFVLLATIVFCQPSVTWKGGSPGQPNEWNCPKNWSNYRVPDAFSNVIIPDVSTTSLANPIIQNCNVEVNSILLQSNATLTVELGAQLIIHDTQNGFGSGSGLILRGTLINIDQSKEIALKRALAIESDKSWLVVNKKD